MADNDAQETPSDFHRRTAANFTELIRGTTDWEAPAPVPDWRARDIVTHLLGWFPALLAQGSAYRIEPGPDPDADLLGAWEHQTAQVQAILDDPATQDATFEGEQMGTQPLRQMIHGFYTGDVFMHSWDLARATGQERGLEEEAAAQMLLGMQPMDQMMRGEHFGPKQPVADDASYVDKLMAFIGRDPGWRPS